MVSFHLGAGSCFGGATQVPFDPMDKLMNRLAFIGDNKPQSKEIYQLQKYVFIHVDTPQAFKTDNLQNFWATPALIIAAV